MKTHSRWRQQVQTTSNSIDEPTTSTRSQVAGKMAGPEADRLTHRQGWTWTSPAGITHTDHPEPPLT